MIAVGTLLFYHGRASPYRDILLPIILFPVTIPVLVAAVKATGGYLQGLEMVDIRPWINLLISYDVIFTTVAFLVFDSVVEE